MHRARPLLWWVWGLDPPVSTGRSNPSCTPASAHGRPPRHPCLPAAGRLTAKALDPLLGGALPGLRELYLTDQSKITYNKVQALLKKRKRLRVQAGETDSDSAAWGCVLREMGASYGDGLYGRW